MWSRATVLSLAAVAVLAYAVPATAGPAADGTIAAEQDLRLVMGKLRGIRTADVDHPVRVAIRAEGAALATVHVVLRNADGELVSKSKRFALAEGERKDVRLEVDGPLPSGTYTARASGRTD